MYSCSFTTPVNRLTGPLPGQCGQSRYYSTLKHQYTFEKLLLSLSSAIETFATVRMTQTAEKGWHGSMCQRSSSPPRSAALLYDLHMTISWMPACATVELIAQIGRVTDGGLERHENSRAKLVLHLCNHCHNTLRSGAMTTSRCTRAL